MRMIESDKVVPLFRLLLIGKPEEVADEICEDVQAIVDIHTVDATPVVRCKDCENWHREVTALNACACAFWSGGKGRVRYTRADDYCSHGEQMDEEEGEKE